MKGFVHHTPTDDDVVNVMTEFTVDFLLKGYRFLVNDLLAKLSSDKELVRLRGRLAAVVGMGAHPHATHTPTLARK